MEQLTVRAKSGEVQGGGVRFAVDHGQVRLEVAVAEPSAT